MQENKQIKEVQRRQTLDSNDSDDTIWYNIDYLRALKSWQIGQLSLAHGTETKN